MEVKKTNEERIILIGKLILLYLCAFSLINITLLSHLSSRGTNKHLIICGIIYSCLILGFEYIRKNKITRKGRLFAAGIMTHFLTYLLLKMLFGLPELY